MTMNAKSCLRDERYGHGRAAFASLDKRLLRLQPDAVATAVDDLELE